MAIQLTEGEGYAFNVLTGQLKNMQQEVSRCIIARASYIEVLKIKYKADFVPETGEFIPKKAEKKGKDAKD